MSEDISDQGREHAIADRLQAQQAWDQPTEDLAFLLRRAREARAAGERRVTELLEANNREVERRRAAEDEVFRLSGILKSVFWARGRFPNEPEPTSKGEPPCTKQLPRWQRR